MLQGANTQLRERVQDLAADLQGAEEEVAALEGLQEQLAAEVGADEHIKALVDAAVAREHAVQEARNRKVLDLLSSKVRHHACACGASCSMLSCSIFQLGSLQNSHTGSLLRGPDDRSCGTWCEASYTMWIVDERYGVRHHRQCAGE